MDEPRPDGRVTSGPRTAGRWARDRCGDAARAPLAPAEPAHFSFGRVALAEPACSSFGRSSSSPKPRIPRTGVRPSHPRCPALHRSRSRDQELRQGTGRDRRARVLSRRRPVRAPCLPRRVLRCLPRQVLRCLPCRLVRRLPRRRLHRRKPWRAATGGSRRRPYDRAAVASVCRAGRAVCHPGCEDARVPGTASSVCRAARRRTCARPGEGVRAPGRARGRGAHARLRRDAGRPRRGAGRWR